MKRLAGASIKKLQQNLTSFEYFVLWIVDQANKSYVIIYDLLAWTTFHRKKYLYEVKLCCNVWIEAPATRLI